MGIEKLRYVGKALGKILFSGVFLDESERSAVERNRRVMNYVIQNYLWDRFTIYGMKESISDDIQGKIWPYIVEGFSTNQAFVLYIKVDDPRNTVHKWNISFKEFYERYNSQIDQIINYPK